MTKIEKEMYRTNRGHKRPVKHTCTADMLEDKQAQARERKAKKTGGWWD